MTYSSRNKKGSLIDAIMMPAMIMVIGMTTLLDMYIWVNFQDTMAEVVAEKSYNATMVKAMDEIKSSYATIDYMFPVIVGGLLLISLLFAYKSGAGVVYIFVSLFLWIFALLMSAVYNNIFEKFAESFTSVSGDFGVLMYVNMNLKWLVLLWLVLISLVMFTRNKSDENNIVAGTGIEYG